MTASPLMSWPDTRIPFSYELFCLIGKRVPRVYYREGKEVGAVNYLIDEPLTQPAGIRQLDTKSRRCYNLFVNLLTVLT